ncbi:MAG TPA: ABC transporter substrate-binding protein [Roseobacter sp.]|uniref:Leucine-binding protein domain-containing protein n=1 Tax=marine sediment metagenome TaxID=412755 RepID=A0A0F9SBQ0_9ZZZZ|nr:ABC transporter substrate-binding protein [Roseobacter sp.]HEC70235.1 ABC transporter substrate-binding protein [Roseobacter sp.]|tara:strand:+ start:223 stop:1539 length:1317 start_codon:yes stop_codon:yes gene_type:complete
MKKTGIYGALSTIGLMAGLAGSATAQEDTFKIGIITFLSGQAAESFGVPALNGGKLLIDMMNKGDALPAPYNTKGFGGLNIEYVVVDEAGGATKQVQEFRNLVQREEVDAVLGYVSSGDCLAVPPVADELKAFTILYDCGTPRVFEDGKFEYVFRTAAHATMDNISLARYLKSRNFDVPSYAGLNQDYAFGQDSWADFTASMKQIYPDAEIKTALFPKFGAGQYGTEISALLREKPALVHSSNWGGDLQGFLIQATARGLDKRSQLVLSAGDHVIPQLQDKMPDGIFLGARGVNGLAAYARGGELKELTDTMWDAYEAEYGVFPVQAPFRMWQALFGLKTAVEKAMADNGGKKPSDEELVAAMKGLEWDAPSGHIEMALADGHQAIQPNAIGTTKWNADAGKMELVDVEYYAARCVNPPEGVLAADWIAQGFPGAECD